MTGWGLGQLDGDAELSSFKMTLIEFFPHSDPSLISNMFIVNLSLKMSLTQVISTKMRKKIMMITQQHSSCYSWSKLYKSRIALILCVLCGENSLTWGTWNSYSKFWGNWISLHLVVMKILGEAWHSQTMTMTMYKLA